VENFIKGEFCLSQRKSIWNRGRKFQILKMLRKILFIYLWLFAKELWKGFTKEFAKTKHVVQAWSKMSKIEGTIHAYLISIYIGSIQSNLCTYIMQTSSIMHFHICFVCVGIVGTCSQLQGDPTRVNRDVNRVLARDGNSSVNLTSHGHCAGVFIGVWAPSVLC
jgi:hypothetical protein